jgi:hypothetical protein
VTTNVTLEMNMIVVMGNISAFFFAKAKAGKSIFIRDAV